MINKKPSPRQVFCLIFLQKVSTKKVPEEKCFFGAVRAVLGNFIS
jgi:hypothetical protein